MITSCPVVLTLPNRFDIFPSGCAATISDGEPVAFRDRRSHRSRRANGTSFRRFVLALAGFTVLPPLLIAAFIVAVDPAYIFGSPSLPHVNAVRPYYEGRVLVAKPYQVWRQRPSAVSLGSSRVEVGIDPRHPGWIDTNAFNFAMPSSNSYAVMLAFLHAQRVGAPLEQAVVDSFLWLQHQLRSGSGDPRRPVCGRHQQRIRPVPGRKTASDASRPPPPRPQLRFPREPGVERSALSCGESGVAAAIARKEFASGREHYDPIGRTQRRDGGSVPADWDEIGYRQVYIDVVSKLRRAGFSADIINISWSGTARGGSAGFSPRIGTKNVISPPIRTRAIGWPRAPTGPAICTMSGSA